MGDAGTLIVCLLVIGAVIYWQRGQGKAEAEADRQALTAGPDDEGRPFVPQVSSLFPVTGKPARWRAGIAIDPASQRIVVKNGPDQRVIAFDQLVHVEPLYDGRSAVQDGNSTTGALVGGALLGPLGVVGGAVLGSKARVKRVTLKLWTNDLQRPVEELVFYDNNVAVRTTDKWLAPVLPEVEAWYGRLRVIVQRNQQIVRVQGNPEAIA